MLYDGYNEYDRQSEEAFQTITDGLGIIRRHKAKVKEREARIHTWEGVLSDFKAHQMRDHELYEVYQGYLLHEYRTLYHEGKIFHFVHQFGTRDMYNLMLHMEWDDEDPKEFQFVMDYRDYLLGNKE